MADLAVIKEISIIEIAKKMGYTPIKAGTRYFSLREHDSVRIDSRSNLFIQNSTGAKGSVIDFVMNFQGISFKEALEFLKEESTCIKKDVSPLIHGNDEKTPFILPKADSNMKNIFAYLVKSRGIDAEIVKTLVRNRQIYQDVYKNCVFVSYKDGQANFASIRGSNTAKRFVADVAGSDYKYCFFVDNNGKSIVVTESVIDAMSVMTLLKLRGAVYDDKDYLALSGTTKYEEAIKNLSRLKQYEKIRLCLDNDSAGRLYEENIRTLLKKLNYEGIVISDLPQNGKDKNEELTDRRSKPTI